MKALTVTFIVMLIFALFMFNPAVAHAQIDSGTTTLYMRSDLYTTYNTTGYGLDRENTASAVTVSVAESTLRCGIRVFTLTSSGESELTGGTPVAEVNRTITGTGTQTATYSMADHTLDAGNVALIIRVYMYAASAWTVKAVFVSEVVLAKGIAASTWSFSIYTNLTGATSSVRFGSNDVKAYVTGISFDEPYAMDVGLHYFGQFDFLNFFLYPYIHLIGFGPLVSILLFGFGVTAYIRFRSFTWILLVMVLLSVGGVLNILVGEALWGAVALLAAFALGALYWKVFR